MSLAPRKAFLAKASSSKDRSSGKENERPPSTATAAVKKCKQQVPRILVIPCSNDDQTKGGTIAGSVSCQKGLAIANAFSSAKKLPFDVHCDEEDAMQRHLRLPPSLASEPGASKTIASSAYSASSAPSRDQRIDRMQSVLGTGKRRGLSQKLSQDDRIATEGRQSRRHENALPSKIPRRRVRSSSTNSDTRGLSSRPPPKTVAFVTAGSSCSTTDQTYMIDRIATETREAYIAVTPNVNAMVQRNCNGRIPGNRIVDSIDSIDSAVFPKITSTPVRNVRLPETTNSRFGGLTCNADYHADLPIVEREKEYLAPKLSGNFLMVHVNAEQRKVIVKFMIRLGTHCKFPSYIIYRAVKIFDTTIDRIRVDTAFIQITALASLWIALKILENSDKIPTASLMISLAKDLYAGKQHLLIEYERKILRALDYNVSFADAYSLLSYHLINYNFCSNITQDVFQFLFYAGSYVIDLTLLDESFCRTSASLVTETAVELVLGLVLDQNQADVNNMIRPRWQFWRGLLCAAAGATGFIFMDRLQNDRSETDRCRVAMLRSMLNSNRTGSGFEVVYRKYSRSRYGRIAKPLLDLAAKLSPFELFDP
nr:uncharacterized protein LOC117229941 isoform X2 [Megalopta genalis]